jgi:hypothetical protein
MGKGRTPLGFAVTYMRRKQPHLNTGSNGHRAENEEEYHRTFVEVFAGQVTVGDSRHE